MASVVNKILGNEIENSYDTNEKAHGFEPEYKNINSVSMNFIYMFRNAIGDF